MAIRQGIAASPSPALIVLRCAVAALLAAHGWARLLTGGVAPFGEWLAGQGVPLGPLVAQGITWFEILATPVLALGRAVPALCAAFTAIYVTGIVMVHAPEGWFVVGLGRNGMEYSVLLVVCLLCIGWDSRITRT